MKNIFFVLLVTSLLSVTQVSMASHANNKLKDKLNIDNIYNTKYDVAIDTVPLPEWLKALFGVQSA